MNVDVTYITQEELDDYVSKFKTNKRDSLIDDVINDISYQGTNIEDDPEYIRLKSLLITSNMGTTGSAGYSATTGSSGTKSKSKYHA